MSTGPTISTILLAGLLVLVSSSARAGQSQPTPSPTPTPVPLVAACGNGALDGTEECDDGNTSNADGCSATCQLEDTSARCAGVSESSAIAIDAQLIANGLDRPVFIHAPPLDPTRLFIVEQRGVIQMVRNGARSVFLDIDSRVTNSGGEQGLLSMAFDPHYETNGRFFINYIDNSGVSVVARYQVSNSLNFADATSERILITINRPAVNHNGGQLAFGPDGYLYFGMGDSGGGGDPGEVAQSLDTLLGKILRFDVDMDTEPYFRIPPSNPNAAAGLPLGLIWAYGLRNPWRFGFDRDTGDLYIGDVGQGEREEIDFQPASSTSLVNYGWDIFEGTDCFEPAPQPNCPSPAIGFTFPIFEYDHSQGCSLTGGYVYRGCALPALRGRYFFSDFCTPFIRSMRVVNGTATDLQDHTSDLDPPGPITISAISSYGEDARGELYIADHAGEVFKIVPQVSATPTPSTTFTRTPTRTATPTVTRTATTTRTSSPTRTSTRTRSGTRTATAAASATPSRTHTSSPSPELPATNTPRPSASPTPSATVTIAVTATSTAAATASPTDSPSPTATTTATSTTVPSATQTASPTASEPAPSATATPPSPTMPAATATPIAPCAGDCDANGQVSVSELLRAVRITLNQEPLSACPTFGTVDPIRVEDLVRAVNNSLHGCSADSLRAAIRAGATAPS